MAVTSRKDEIEVIAGQLVAQSIMTQIVMGHLAMVSEDRGAGIRHAVETGISTMQMNPNMTTLEKFGAVKTLEDALDMIDQIRSAS
ncbi:hypothetical protein C5F48_23565 [Cereibacter changlensis JA139]|uniref:Uncharacterized protein n=2 Tax=Cereibacter changlensis TaxID=402884 RepID=A0A2T4JLE8_9RHOB|nr:hypothetical protein [Cereibacter changlensis]PTE18731.1 hypothetical protein C5F48_23565 [Cereibacter changlensis JA139]PZX46534.1 hypothetical protein LX76_04625 [Cereibacter changlensis]